MTFVVRTASADDVLTLGERNNGVKAFKESDDAAHICGKIVTVTLALKKSNAKTMVRTYFDRRRGVKC